MCFIAALKDVIGIFEGSGKGELNKIDSKDRFRILKIKSCKFFKCAKPHKRFQILCPGFPLY